MLDFKDTVKAGENKLSLFFYIVALIQYKRKKFLLNNEMNEHSLKHFLL